MLRPEDRLHRPVHTALPCVHTASRNEQEDVCTCKPACSLHLHLQLAVQSLHMLGDRRRSGKRQSAVRWYKQAQNMASTWLGSTSGY